MIIIKKSINLFFMVIFCLLLMNCFLQHCYAGETSTTFSTTPIKKAHGKWRIGYLEGGDYREYHRSINATIQGLMSLGWIKESPLLPLENTTGKALWEAYSSSLKSEYLEFVSNGFYTAEWNQEKRKIIQKKILSRLNETKDLDLVIAMGTWAGIDLSQGNHQTPIIVLAVSDAVSSGIIKSIHDSGNDFIHARIDPERYERQVQIFHTLIGFNTLGMIYRNDIEGKSYAAVDKVNKVARERGFTVRSCFLKKSATLEDDEQRLIHCFKTLAMDVDAIYVTAQTAVNKKTIPIIADIAKDKKIPTFSQAGFEEVKMGLLLSISQAGFKYIGAFYAKTIAKIFNNALPGDLNQIFADPSKIAFNLSTAEAIGFYPSLEVLSSADEIYIEEKKHNEQ